MPKMNINDGFEVFCVQMGPEVFFMAKYSTPTSKRFRCVLPNTVLIVFYLFCLLVEI